MLKGSTLCVEDILSYEHAEISTEIIKFLAIDSRLE